MATITLCTLNAKHIHASLGLRYLRANMGELKSQTLIREFTLEPWPIDIAEKLLAEKPKIIGLGVYIWNAEKTHQLVALLKTLSPETTIILGGPEVSHEWENQPIIALADYLITGQADLAFGHLCNRLLNNDRPDKKIHHPPSPALEQLILPYAEYTDEDIRHRLIYVEASRGCPFKCEFCLSALDKTAIPFPRNDFLDEMNELHRRGVRHFKFVDRTFNLNPEQSIAILEFFLERMDEELFLHFEVIPDHLSARLKNALSQYPAGHLQLEIGIQSFNPQVQRLISRRQDNEKTQHNLVWLRQQTQAHLHADLIIGLPGEDLPSIARGFDQLVALAPQEIQLGMLKRLKGTPIIRHTEVFQLRFNPSPPFTILSTSLIDFTTMQQLNRFVRYWEMIGNSGRFPHTLPILLADSPFKQFSTLSQWLFETTGQVHRIALKRLFDLLYKGMTAALGLEPDTVRKVLTADFERSKIKGQPAFLRDDSQGPDSAERNWPTRNIRQQRHGE